MLIISAVYFEAEPTLAMLSRNGLSHEYMEIGIGPLNAAKSAAELKIRAASKRVIFLGSAGSFGEFSFPYLSIVDWVWWMPTAERMGLAKYMEGLHQPLHIPQTNNFALPVKQILASSSVSYRGEIAIDLPPRDDLIENMEAYSVAGELVAVAESVDILMGITNGVGPEGSRLWQQNHGLVAEMTAAYLEQELCR